MNTPISVIVPVYNSEKTLGRCIESILCQTYRDFELILVDDGSQDQSLSICDGYAGKDSRIRVMHKQNGGVSSARNKGMDAAMFDWLTFVDSDDSLPQNAFELLSNGIRDKENIWMCVGGFSAGRDNGDTTVTVLPDCKSQYSDTSSFFDGIFRQYRCPLRAPWGKLFKKTALRFEESLNYGEDILFITNYIAAAPAEAKYSVVNAPVYNYSLMPDGLSADVNSERQIIQLLNLVPLYADAIERLQNKIPQSIKAQKLYHTDLVGRFCCRILTFFATKKTELLSKSNISKIYSFMARDSRLGLFSVRAGQIPNLILFKIGSPALTQSVYKITRRLNLNAIRHNPFQ